MAYVVSAKWRAKPGKEERLKALIEEMTEPSRAEPGNVYYQAQRSIEDPQLFYLYEQYVDEDGYKAHQATDAFKENILGKVVPMLESRQRNFYEVVEP